MMRDDPAILRAALEGIIDYALSRVDDMHENAEATHGEGKAYRCACYRRAQAAYASALKALGWTTAAEIEEDWAADMRHACVTDPGELRGSCSWDGAECASPADDLEQIEEIRQRLAAARSS